MMLKRLIRLFFNYELIKTKKAPNLESLLRVILKKDIANFFDVGANIGQFIKKIRKSGFDGKIYAFEPISTNFEKLKNLKDKNLECYQNGFGIKNQNIEINVTSGTDLSSILEPNKQGSKLLGDKINIVRKEIIQIKRFDSFFDPKKHLNNLLKIDTQGYDLNVLKGASSILKNINYILIETSFIKIYKNSPDFYEVNQYLNDNNFYLTNIYPLSKNKDGSIVECDCLYKNIEQI